MKGILGLLRPAAGAGEEQGAPDTQLFTTAFADQGADPSMLVPWEARAVEVGAERLGAARGMRELQALWSRDRHMRLIEPQAFERLERYFDFARVPAHRRVIRQDEYGNFMVVLLAGTIAIERQQPGGERLTLAQARAGEILGEMSLLDSGIRFSGCATLEDCEMAVLGAEALDQMLGAEPRLAASLIALLARKLSLRLRVVSARLSESR